MNKFVTLLASGSALVAVASPAMAQNADPFTGARVGAIVGYDKTKAGSTVDNDTTKSDDQSIDGLLYGAEVGYDVAVSPSFVVGAEAEYTESTAKTGFDRGDFEGFGIGNVKAGRDMYAGVRAGFRASPNTLVYAKAGYTNARFDVRSSDGTVDTKTNVDTDGYRLGAGVDEILRATAKLYVNCARRIGA